MSDLKEIQLATAVAVAVSDGSSDQDLKTSAVVSNDSIDHEEKPSSWLRRTIGYVWDSAEGTPRNRRYVQKLDAYML